MMSKILSSEIVFEGKVFKVERRTIELEDGKTIMREVVVKNPVVVCIVNHLSQDSIILTKEYRVGSDEIEYGLVAGIIDEGEQPIDAVKREVLEETGYEAMGIDFLGDAYSSSGFTNEHVYYFYVEVNGEPKEQNLDSDESIDLFYAPVEGFENMFHNDMIKGNHAHTALLKSILRGSKLDREIQDTARYT